MVTYYNTCVDYIKCAQDIKDKIDRIDAIIEALEDAELNLALNNGERSEYSFDDGQTKIKEVFTGHASIENAINALTKRKNRLVNSCIGYRYGLQDGNIKLP